MEAKHYLSGTNNTRNSSGDERPERDIGTVRDIAFDKSTIALLYYPSCV